MKKFLSLALALVMTIGAFAQSQIAAHRLDVAKETKKEFKLNSRNLDPSNLKKLVPNETKAMSIDIDIVTIGALSVEATFTPNDEVAAYYYLVTEASEDNIINQYLAIYEMFGMTATDANGKRVGARAKVTPQPMQGSGEGVQLSFFQLDDPVLCQIRDEILGLDINNLTPMEALNKLNDIKKIVGG